MPDKVLSTSDSEATERRRIVIVLGAVSALFTICRALFVWQSPNIIGARPNAAAELVTPWVRWAIAEHDGIETVVALTGMLGLLALASIIALRAERSYPTRRVALLVGGLGALCAFSWALRTRSSEFIEPSSHAAFGWFLGFAAGAGALFALLKQAPRIAQRVAAALVFVAFVALVLMSLPPASVQDYSYYLGPALKLLQGERLGTFYMQYDLLGTLLCAGMAACGLLIHQMQLVLALLFCAWFVLYHALIRRLFHSRAIGALLLLALAAARFLAIRDHPAFLPQILPTRLDMWVPLMLAVDHFGLRSRKTSAAFALAYALDATFGLLSAFGYALALCVATVREKPRSMWQEAARELAPNAAMLCAAALFQKLVFGSFVSRAASHYVAVQLGFLPIAEHSLFWPIGLLIACAAVIFTLSRNERASRLGLLLSLLAVLHLTYFFGRSHDHNLLNLSGAWLFPIFLALDQGKALGRLRFGFATALVCGLIVLCTAQGELKWERASARLHERDWLPRHPIEDQLEVYRAFAGPRVMLLELADAYPNYRLGLAQRGYFAPFESNVFLADTARYLRTTLDSGLSLLTSDPRVPMWLAELDRTGELVTPGVQLLVSQGAGVLVITERRRVP